MEAVQTDGILLESKRFNNDTAVIKANNTIFNFYGNWANKWSPVMGINILVSNNDKDAVILKFSSLHLKNGNGEDAAIGGILKKEKDGSYVYLRQARKGDKENTDLPEDFRLPPGSKSEFDVGFSTSTSLGSAEKEKIFYLSLPIELEGIADSKKDLEAAFKAVENRAGNKPYPID